MREGGEKRRAESDKGRINMEKQTDGSVETGETRRTKKKKKKEVKWRDERSREERIEQEMREGNKGREYKVKGRKREIERNRKKIE